MKSFENWAPALIPPPHFKPDKELGRLEGDRDTFYPGLYILLFAIPATKKLWARFCEVQFCIPALSVRTHKPTPCCAYGNTQRGIPTCLCISGDAQMGIEKKKKERKLQLKFLRILVRIVTHPWEQQHSMEEQRQEHQSNHPSTTATQPKQTLSHLQVEELLVQQHREHFQFSQGAIMKIN